MGLTDRLEDADGDAIWVIRKSVHRDSPYIVHRKIRQSAGAHRHLRAPWRP